MRDYPRRVAFDSSECGNHGHICGAVWDKNGGRQCLSFNGTSDYVDCGNDGSLNVDNVSIASWYMLTANGNYPMLASRNEAPYELTHNADTRQPRLSLNTAGGLMIINSDDAISLSAWTFVVGIYDGTSPNIYINGAPVSGFTYVLGPFTGALVASANNLLLGKRVAGYHFQGLIASVQIWNRALSADEIEMLYNEGK